VKKQLLIIIIIFVSPRIRVLIRNGGSREIDPSEGERNNN
jgi:hypothetical protein